jgi:hypothetical protein
MSTAKKQQAANQYSAIQTKPLPVTSRMLALEPRFVFDAAIATALHDITHIDVTANDHHDAPVSAGAAIVTAAQDLAQDLAQFDAPDAASGEAHIPGTSRLLEVLVQAHNMAPSNHEIAFIDSRLADLGTLIKAVPEGTKIVLIDGAKDGVQQMVDALKGQTGITGLHILSHGSAVHISTPKP